MTLAPQKAKAQENETAAKTAKKEEKRERRVAPEYTLVWSDAATKAVTGRSGEFIKQVYANAYARIYRAEAALCGVMEVVTIGRVDPIDTFKDWWAPFEVEDLRFVLRYHDALIREYELVPFTGPTPDGGGEPPVITRRQKTPPPKRIAPPPRPRKSDGGAKASRPAATKKHPKQTDAKRELTILYRFARRTLRVAERKVTDRFEQLQRGFKPRLLRSFVHVRRISGNCLHSLRDAAEPVVQTAQELRALAKRLRTSFTGPRDFPVQTIGRGATLVPRCAGQSTGLNILFYSWSSDEPPPVDWSQYLFGVDWTLNLFGVLPEKERVFT